MPIKYGVASLLRSPMTTRDGAIAVAQKAEALGFDYLGGNDHVIVPTDINSAYPYEADHKWPGAKIVDCLDVLTTIAFLSGCTDRIRLLTSVMVVPYRPAVLTAKMLATADVLSNGRIIAGCGVGWMPEEFEALDAPSFSERGAVTDEYIAAFKELWTKDKPSFAGKHVRFNNIAFGPQPIQKPLPIWVGGESGLALQRVVRYGNGWYPASRNPKKPFDTAERMVKGIAEFKAYCEKAGRDPSSIDVALLVLWPVNWSPDKNTEGERKLMTGTPDDMAADIEALYRGGLTHITLTLQAPSLSETLERMQRFTEDVMAPLRKV